MRTTWRFAASVLVLAAAGAAGCGPKVGSDVGLRAADFALEDASGKTIRLSDFDGKVVVLDFWATWCPPCEREIPGFVDLQTKYKDRGLVVLGVSIDDSWDPIGPFATAHRMNYPIVLLRDRKLLDAYGVDQGIPTTFVIDRSGVIRMRHVGYADRSVFAKAIDGLL